MLVHVLGAPGSGKTSLRPELQRALPGWVVLDWDAAMAAAGVLAGSDIATDERTWQPYGELMRAFVEQLLPGDLVLLGVCTPSQLDGWPEGSWLLLDCDDQTRRRRLASHSSPAEIEEALADAAAYRELGFPSADTTRLTPLQSARELARHILALVD